MRWSLRYKIFAMLGGLVMGLLLTTLVLVGVQAGNAAKEQILIDLQGTRKQFDEVQRLRFQSLLAFSRMLGAEFALLNAVATYHPETVQSAARSYQSRIQGDFFLVTDDDGKLLATTVGPMKPGDDLTMYPTIKAALADGESLYIWPINNKLYQVTTVPLKVGPDLLGSLSIGYEITRDLLKQLQQITGSEITVVIDGNVLTTTWEKAAGKELANYLKESRWDASRPTSEAENFELREITIKGEKFMSLAVPLAGPEVKPIGFYILQRSLDQAMSYFRRIRRALLITGLLALAVALVVSFILARGVTRPVHELVKGAEALGRGDYQSRVNLTSRDELGVLAGAYNSMAAKLEANISALNKANSDLQDQTQALEGSLRKVAMLEQMRAHLGKFVPDSVKRSIEKSPEAPDLEKRDRDVTVLFLDVAGYTRMSEKSTREKLNELIERYFSSFLDDIYENNGDINETAGDGLMIIFHAEDPKQNATDAVRTALAIQRKVAEINTSNLADRIGEMEPIAINVGINSGIAAVGSTRFEGLTGERWTFTASGQVTNISARLAALATQGEIFLGPETASRVEESFKVNLVGERNFKNLEKPVMVYQVHLADNLHLLKTAV